MKRCCIVELTNCKRLLIKEIVPKFLFGIHTLWKSCFCLMQAIPNAACCCFFLDTCNTLNVNPGVRSMRYRPT